MPSIYKLLPATVTFSTSLASSTGKIASNPKSSEPVDVAQLDPMTGSLMLQKQHMQKQKEVPRRIRRKSLVTKAAGTTQSRTGEQMLEQMDPISGGIFVAPKRVNDGMLAGPGPVIDTKKALVTAMGVAAAAAAAKLVVDGRILSPRRRCGQSRLTLPEAASKAAEGADVRVRSQERTRQLRRLRQGRQHIHGRWKDAALACLGSLGMARAVRRRRAQENLSGTYNTEALFTPCQATLTGNYNTQAPFTPRTLTCQKDSMYTPRAKELVTPATTTPCTPASPKTAGQSWSSQNTECFQLHEQCQVYNMSCESDCESDEEVPDWNNQEWVTGGSRRLSGGSSRRLSGGSRRLSGGNRTLGGRSRRLSAGQQWLSGESRMVSTDSLDSPRKVSRAADEPRSISPRKVSHAGC
ncbi:unnamed protein product [Polarella glacialis]|uniref:Uncharacterized protein n=1 Tax=Polarella glacialis TaxID=89957 RepID=A0A813DL52_POLGL|nr:unnamed protein product [Polarella glacialis]CAE8721569.1 unnamed protein product [Polarella glacialis]